MRSTKFKIALMLLTALFMTSCRSSKPMLEQRQTERIADTVRETIYLCDTVAETVTVYDTIRETTTIQLNAEGDTMSRTTEREHVSDRTRERASASQQTATSQRSHDEESTSDEKQTVIEQPKRWLPWYTLMIIGWGLGLLTAWGIMALIRRKL